MLKDFKPEIKIFLVVALVAVILAVGSILLLRAMQQPAPTPQPQTEVLDTSNWQTYRSEEFGFEFKYSPFLQEDEGTDQTDILSYCNGETVELFASDIAERCSGTYYRIGITVYNESYDPERISKYYDAPPLLPDGTSGIEEYQINGKKFSIGKHSVYTYVGWATHTALRDKTLGISFSGNAYVLQPNSNELTQEEFQNIAQILSTFRFLDE